MVRIILATLPSGVTKIDNWTFERCESLTSVTFPRGVKSIAHVAFGGCTSLEKIVLPAGLELIGVSAFSQCTGLKSVEFSSDNLKIDRYAFDSCTSLESITFPPCVKEIEDESFGQCKSLSVVIFTDGIKKIHKHAFKDCDKLTRIVLPDGVKKYQGSVLETLWKSFRFDSVGLILMMSFVRQYPDVVRNNNSLYVGIRSNTDFLFRQILKTDDVESLEFIFSLQKRVSLDKIYEYLSLSRGNAAVSAFLLEYKNRRYPLGENVDDEFEDI